MELFLWVFGGVMIGWWFTQRMVVRRMQLLERECQRFEEGLSLAERKLAEARRDAQSWKEQTATLLEELDQLRTRLAKAEGGAALGSSLPVLLGGPRPASMAGSITDAIPCNEAAASPRTGTTPQAGDPSPVAADASGTPNGATSEGAELPPQKPPFPAHVGRMVDGVQATCRSGLREVQSGLREMHSALRRLPRTLRQIERQTRKALRFPRQ